ncbi:MAG: hypothetical protein NT069_11065 [Planctomycetota bacterium]|nr:hypothetical protein [Planctomycetota bacterium]
MKSVQPISRRLSCVTVMLAAMGGGACDHSSTRPGEGLQPSTAVDPAADENSDDEMSHQETLAWIQQHRAWRRVRKTKPIWARAVTADEVGKEFQTADRAVESAREGFWLSVGVAGEPWFQDRAKIDAKYTPGESVSKQFSFDDAPREYQVFHPKPDVMNWGAQIVVPTRKGFNIHPSYDPSLALFSPSGGYVVKPDVDDPYADEPDHVWLVQQPLFESTYEFVE